MITSVSKEDWALVGGEPCSTNFDISYQERKLLMSTEKNCRLAQSVSSQVNLIRAIKYVIKNNIFGDLVECGVYEGGSAFIFASICQAYNDLRNIYLFDTFEGMPMPGENDIWWNKERALDNWKTVKKIGEYGSDHVYSSLDRVVETCKATNYPFDKFIFVKGLVEKTIPHHKLNSIAILRLDTDYYESTLHELNNLYDLVTKGGIIIIDDYGANSGCRKAVDNFFESRNKYPFLFRADESVRFVIKD